MSSQITLWTRQHGAWHFYCSDREDSSYVYCRPAADFGMPYKQPCEGGSWMGSTLYATPATLEKVARKWLRDRFGKRVEKGK